MGAMRAVTMSSNDSFLAASPAYSAGVLSGVVAESEWRAISLYGVLRTAVWIPRAAVIQHPARYGVRIGIVHQNDESSDA